MAVPGNGRLLSTALGSVARYGRVLRLTVILVSHLSGQPFGLRRKAEEDEGVTPWFGGAIAGW